MSTKMHADEVDIDVDLVRRLLATQFPHWAHLPIQWASSSGTDHAIYRLGNDMSVRLPKIHWATGQVAKEQRWLPFLAPQLPLATPVPLAIGEPGEGYPWQWSVYRWLAGNDATTERIADLRQTAIELAQFVAAMQQIDPADGPASARGPLAARDAHTRTAIASLGGLIDTDAATAAWEASLDAPTWGAAPVWTHGDLLPTNLLVERGQLSAVIDFGCVGVGDPAYDLLCAWSVLSASTRDIFRGALAVEDATWLRGRGFALSVALIQLPYYQKTNPILATNARYVIDEVLADQEQGV